MKRVFLFIFKVFVTLPIMIFFPTKIIGKENLLKREKYVTISNHMGSVDPFLLAIYIRGFRYYLAKKELGKNRFVKWIMSMVGAIFIDRNSMDLKAIKKCINSLKDAPLAIFPEGTRNKDSEELQTIKGGAAMIATKANVPLVPIMFHHRAKVFRKNYVFIAPAITLPYNDKDRFNGEAMEACSALITESMQSAKDTLNNMVETKGFKAYKKSVKAKKKEHKLDRNNHTHIPL